MQLVLFVAEIGGTWHYIDYGPQGTAVKQVATVMQTH